MQRVRIAGTRPKINLHRNAQARRGIVGTQAVTGHFQLALYREQRHRAILLRVAPAGSGALDAFGHRENLENDHGADQAEHHADHDIHQAEAGVMPICQSGWIGLHAGSPGQLM